MRFTQYPRRSWAEILGPDADLLIGGGDATDLVANLVRFESQWRITAREVSNLELSIGLSYPLFSSGDKGKSVFVRAERLTWFFAPTSGPVGTPTSIST